MARRPSLESAVPSRKPPPPPVPAVREVTRQRSPARAGKRGVAFWLNPLAFKQLGQISLDEDRSVQSLMEEAADMLFQSRGKHRLAQEREEASA